MGIIIAKFRKKQSTYDVLTKLENEISSIEEFQKRTQETRRKIVFRFVLVAVILFIISLLVLYFYFPKISSNKKILWIIPFLASPLVIWSIKTFLTWYYNRKIKRNEKKLISLKEKKKKIIENVMETETYKIAKEILDKFANEPKKPLVSTPFIKSSTPVISTPTTTKSFESVCRQRYLVAQNTLKGRASFGGVASPFTPPMSVGRQIAIPPTVNKKLHNQSTLSRSILPKDRSVLEKMVDYLVGDGPSNRYALICQNCNGHNGMALKEEFVYVSFKCCYCSHFNPARQKRPIGPKVEPIPSSLRMLTQKESSDSDKNSENDSDLETPDLLPLENASDSPDNAIKAESDSNPEQDKESETEHDDHIRLRKNVKTTDHQESGDM